MRRSTGEVLVIMLTAVIAFVIIIAAITIAVVEVREPASDTTLGVELLTSAVSTVLGALLGIMVCRGPSGGGRSDSESGGAK